MRTSLKALAVAGVLGLTAGNLRADAAATPTPTPWYSKVAVSGYIDGFYQYNLNGLSNTSPIGRAFDNTQNEFTLNAAKLGLVWSDAPSGTGAELDLLYGNIAKVINGGSATASQAIEQAFITKAFGPVTFKLGKFGTFVGTEVTDTPGNMNYSRDFLFGVIPFYHTGLMVNYAVADGYGLMAYFGDGDSVDTAPTEDKDWGLQATITKVKNLSVIINYYEKVERSGVGTPVNDNKFYFDPLASYTISDSLSVAGEYLYETEKAPTITGVTPYTPKQQGYALYVNYTTPIAGLSLVPRYEQWWAVDGSSTDPWNDLTLTLKYAQGPLTHYLEYRNDSTTPPSFPAAAGASPSLLYSQNTITYAAVYGF
jgi:hypothetical protein